MPKNSVTFSKPKEPAFLRRLKEQIGYKEGPTVDTKRERLEQASFEDFENTEEEQPTVVVLGPGDLSAEEAARAKRQLEREEEEKPADLDAPIVFKTPSKSKALEPENTKFGESSTKRSSSSKNKVSKKQKTTLLSFNEEENDDYCHGHV